MNFKLSKSAEVVFVLKAALLEAGREKKRRERKYRKRNHHQNVVVTINIVVAEGERLVAMRATRLSPSSSALSLGAVFSLPWT